MNTVDIFTATTQWSRTLRYNLPNSIRKMRLNPYYDLLSLSDRLITRLMYAFLLKHTLFEHLMINLKFSDLIMMVSNSNINGMWNLHVPS